MRDNYGYNNKNRKSKGFIVMALACFLCLSAIAVGASALSKKSEKKEQETDDIVDLNTAKKDNEDSSEDKNVAVDGNVVKNTEQETTQGKEDESNKINTDNTNSNQTANGGNIQSSEADGRTDEGVTNNDDSRQTSGTVSEADDVNALVSNLSFGEGSTLQWPVEGNIILDYSMDSTIYFPTLDSYRCNPAIVIQSENGTSVCAGATGVVQEVAADDEIGNYVVVGIGDGYQLTYGQLDNISVAVGETVEPDTAIGVVGEVTRYYKFEGSNVYFKMTKDGNPCDPLDYLE